MTRLALPVTILATLLATLVATLVATLPTSAEPVADSDRVPVDLRRTTLVVRDVDKSLAFYRDALGMQVSYDNDIRTPRSATSDDEAEIARRLVFLRANDDYIGIVGLLQYRKPSKPAPHQGDEPFSTGSMVFVFNVEDLDGTFERVRKTPGIRILSEPSRVEYPSYDGQSTIPVMVSVVTDPDGFVVEINQLLVEQPQKR